MSELTPKERKYQTRINLFLMFFGQQWEQLVRIPMSAKLELMQEATEIVSEIFNTKGDKKAIFNVIKGITDPREYIRLQKEKQNK